MCSPELPFRLPVEDEEITPAAEDLVAAADRPACPYERYLYFHFKKDTAKADEKAGLL